MSQDRVAYHDIPESAVNTITAVINTDEGGFQFNEEANCDWNFAGVLAENIQEYLTGQEIIPVIHTDARVSVRHWLESLALEQQKTLVIEIYYNKYWLPLLPYSMSHGVDAWVFSAAINCGLHTVVPWINNQPTGPKRPAYSYNVIDFCRAWRDHYVKLVVDNAQAWHDWAQEVADSGDIPRLSDKLMDAEPKTFRAPNLAGWLARVDRYA